MPGREAAFVNLLLLPLGCFAFVSLEQEGKRVLPHWWGLQQGEQEQQTPGVGRGSAASDLG